MPDEFIRADFRKRFVIDTAKMEWMSSPQVGVARRMLDRIGGEIARATSLVRYDAGSEFPTHKYELGEEFFVLDGVFSDEQGDYPKGTYVRNPPGSSHAPRTTNGCTIFVKQKQMHTDETRWIVVDCSTGGWRRGCAPDHNVRRLYSNPDAETVQLETFDPGAGYSDGASHKGEEILIPDEELSDDVDQYGAGTWIRNPPGQRTRLHSSPGALIWTNRDHLVDM